MRRAMVRTLKGSPLEWLARDVYYTSVDRMPSWLLPPDLARARDYDKLTFRIAENCLSNGGNFIDVGANAGHILKRLTRISPDGRGWAFEPLPHFATRLRTKFPTVKVEEVALSDQAGLAQFRYLVDDPAYSSLILRPEIEASRTVQTIQVPVKRLDDCIPHNVAVAFIKIDVEGAEASVLRGARRILADFHPVTVFECSPVALSECAAIFGEFGMSVSLMRDYLNGIIRTEAEAIALGRQFHEFYYVANDRFRALKT